MDFIRMLLAEMIYFLLQYIFGSLQIQDNGIPLIST